MTTFDALIKFVDGTEKIITKVDDFSVEPERQCFFVKKNGYIIFIPIDRVLYLGRKFDLEEPPCNT